MAAPQFARSTDSSQYGVRAGCSPFRFSKRQCGWKATSKVAAPRKWPPPLNYPVFAAAAPGSNRRQCQ